MMTTKAMAWFFVFMTILNLPAMIFFYNGNDASNTGLIKNVVEIDASSANKTTSTADSSFTVGTLFAKLSLGNIGQNIASCSVLDLAETK